MYFAMGPTPVQKCSIIHFNVVFQVRNLKQVIVMLYPSFIITYKDFHITTSPTLQKILLNLNQKLNKINLYFILVCRYAYSCTLITLVVVFDTKHY